MAQRVIRGYVFCLTIFLIALSSGCQGKKLPDGISFSGSPHPVHEVTFLRDITWFNQDGQRILDQQIFDEALSMIRNASSFILLDMFLFNNFQGEVREESRALSTELASALIKQKKKHPAIKIYVITDPINTVYGGVNSSLLSSLSEEGISVTITDLDQLRDSNTIYSLFWRLFFQPFGNDVVPILPNPFGGDNVSMRTYPRILNFKANHRKTLLTDRQGELVGLVTSANAHDASAAHHNVAIRFTGPATSDLLATEVAILKFSNGPLPTTHFSANNHTTPITLAIVTEGKIKDAVLRSIQKTRIGDRIALAMFYISDRDVIAELIQARRRGVEIDLLLDPSKDAFGIKKDGVPNIPVGRELHNKKINVRWVMTHGEQFHSKMLLVDYQSGQSTLVLGSANYTRRNLGDFNLESNVIINGPIKSTVFTDARNYFDLIYHGIHGSKTSLEFDAFDDSGLLKGLLYRIQEASGLGTF